MTLKSYLRMLLAAVTLLFVTSGCNDDDDKVGPPPSYSFSVAVSDVAQTEATVTVTPSNDQATYYYAAVKKAEFDTFESDAAYAQHILDNLKAIADKKVLPLSEYLATALVKGSAERRRADHPARTAENHRSDGRHRLLCRCARHADGRPLHLRSGERGVQDGRCSGACLGVVYYDDSRL